MNDSPPLLEINNLNVSYYTRKGEVPAVVDFNLTLRPERALDWWANPVAANPPCLWRLCATWVITAVLKADK